jgi:hypothetical protein
VIAVIAVIAVVVVMVTIDIMRVDPDAAAVAPADARTNGCDVTARPDDGQWCDLRNEDQVGLRVGRDRVRVRGLWDFLDPEVGAGIDHAERGAADSPAGAEVVAFVASFEPLRKSK